MAKQTINIGSGELTGDGESIRSAFSKVNDNFNELYGAGGVDLTSVTTSIIPDQNEQHDLGSPTNKFRDLYLSGNTIYLGTATISIDNQGRIIFSDPAVSVGTETVRGDIEDINGNTIFDSNTGAVSNLEGQPGSYYLDYNNFTNTPTIPTDVSELTDTGGIIGGSTFSGAYADLTGKPGIDEIIAVGATTSRALTVGDLTVDSLTGDGGLSGFAAITGDSTGNITGYSNITADSSFTVGGQSFTGADITEWNTAYGWGDHSTAGYISNSVTGTFDATGLISSDTGFRTTGDDGVYSTTDIETGGSYKFEGTSFTTTLTKTEPTANRAITFPDNDGTVALVSDLANLSFTLADSDTDDLSEGAANLYYTQARFDTAFAAKSTADLSEDPSATVSSGTMYYTDSRVQNYLSAQSYATQNYVNTQIADLSTTAPEVLATLQDIGDLLDNNANLETALTTAISQKLAIADFNTYFDTRLALKDTDDLSEGTTNLYFTNQRAIASFTATGDISLTGGGEISFNNSSGYLTSVTTANIDNGSKVQIADTWTSTDNTIATTGAIAAKIAADLALVTFDDITTNGSTTANTITVGGITTGSIVGVNGAIDFNDATITNMSIDYGTYSGA